MTLPSGWSKKPASIRLVRRASWAAVSKASTSWRTFFSMRSHSGVGRPRRQTPNAGYVGDPSARRATAMASMMAMAPAWPIQLWERWSSWMQQPVPPAWSRSFANAPAPRQQIWLKWKSTDRGKMPSSSMQDTSCSTSASSRELHEKSAVSQREPRGKLCAAQLHQLRTPLPLGRHCFMLSLQTPPPSSALPACVTQLAQ
mmetsp:Transcript_86060/g.267386  ORF Transcript_86060/g.267386 Transcript_86060/m.267386 type:complete len:200 (+) Transcript_86060:89-688(+)